MKEADWRRALGPAYEAALEYLEGLPNRPVRPVATLAALRASLATPLPDHGQDSEAVVADLAAAAEPGVIGSGSGRFFGFVVGGALPAALAADWLTSVWDQNAGLYVIGPAAAVVEDVAASWILELLGLPPTASVGFVTGAQMANFTCLAAARHHVLQDAGWDVETGGLAGAPPVRVVAGAERHSTIDRALRLLGIGTDALVPVAVDNEGRMIPAALAATLRAGAGPTIVCAQVGHVNTGAIDPVAEICPLAREAGAWVHVDGAFGMWAAASPTRRELVRGVDAADSWAVDAHKWLNVPYDSGLAICAHPEAHHAAMGVRASYLVHGSGGERDALDYNPEFSRRARGFAVYAAIRALGRSGLADMVERSCRLARRFAEQLSALPGVTVVNDVVLNQVLVRFTDSRDERDDDVHTRKVIHRVQEEGVCWMSGATWHGEAVMRISVTNWSTDEADVDASVASIARCAAESSTPAR